MDNKNEKLDKLIKEYGTLFNKYDFFIGKEVPENAYKAIDIGGGFYVIFTHKDIKETMNEKLKDFVEEQNKAFKEGKGWIDTDTTENGCNEQKQPNKVVT